MHNDFKHVNDVDRVLRDRNREIEIFVEKKVCKNNKFVFRRNSSRQFIVHSLRNYIRFEPSNCFKNPCRETKTDRA